MGKLGKTVILDHLDGGYTIYGHLHTVDVDVNSHITAGRMIGTMGYSGNAKNLQRKSLPPHLHFAYVRTFAGIGGSGTAARLSRIKDSGEGLRSDLAEDPVWADCVPQMLGGSDCRYEAFNTLHRCDALMHVRSP